MTELNTTLHPKTKVSYGVLSNDCKLTIISCSILIVNISKAANGSSNSKILGSFINAIEITNFFFWPPERCFAFIFRRASNSNWVISLFIFSSVTILKN